MNKISSTKELRTNYSFEKSISKTKLRLKKFTDFVLRKKYKIKNK